MGGVPQSIKRAQVVSPDEAGPSKDALFLETEVGEEVAMEASEAPPVGLVELEGMIQAQTAMLQSQLVTQEWLAGCQDTDFSEKYE